MIFTLSGSIRSKKNSKQFYKIRGRRIIVPSEAYKKWEGCARHELFIFKYQNKIECTFLPVHITAIFYYSGPRPDLQGAMESLADCIQGVIIDNDKQIESWDGSRMVHDKDNPRTVVEITEY
jgi:Holliday junction resolvase RusA-like endonuclease